MSAPNSRACAIAGCDRKHVARGYCRAHYNRHVRGYIPREELQGFNKDDRLEDCQWMAEHGESLTGAASRIGITRAGLERWLMIHDRATLNVLRARDVWPDESRATFHGAGMRVAG